VVNAAGIQAETGIADTTAAVFAQTVAVTLTGTFLVIQAAAPLMRKEGKGTIVNIASGVGLVPTGPGRIAYVASKGGVIAMTKSAAMSERPRRSSTAIPQMSIAALPGAKSADRCHPRGSARDSGEPTHVAEFIQQLGSNGGGHVWPVGEGDDFGSHHHNAPTLGPATGISADRRYPEREQARARPGL